MARPALEIAKKEFTEHVLSWRFLIALVLSTLILSTSVVALGAAYKEDVAAYNQKQDELARSDNSFAATALQVNRWLARPNVLSIFVGGAGDAYRSEAGDGAGILAGGPDYSPESGSASPTNTRFAPLDLGFVAAVVMTFMAVIFSFDAVSGEKERGTLKLVLSNPVPKDAVLLGKYLGGMASVALPLAIALAIGLALLHVMGLALPAGAWTRLGVILLAALALLSAFYLLGLVVSSLSRRSGTSLLALTLVWLVLVFGVGNVAAVAAKEMATTTSTADLQAKLSEIDDRMYAQMQEIQEEFFPLMQKRMRGNLTVDEQARLDALEAQQKEILDQASTERKALRDAASRQLDDQLRLAEAISAVSPAEAFRSLGTALARSDYWTYREMAAAAEAYQAEVQRARAEYEKDNPSAGMAFVFVGSGGAARSIGEEGFEPPEFRYQPASVSSQLASGAGVRDLLTLLGFNLAGFAAAYVAFLRYDVR